MESWILLLRAALVFIALALATNRSSAQAIKIVDGDTLKIGDVTYRLNGNDAPEAGQKCLTERGKPWACGEAAMDRLAEFLNHGSLRCDPITEDGYGRIVATCFAGDTDMGKEMVRSSAAWAFVKYSTIYVSEEAEARIERRGIWKGSAQPAWEFRADRWRVAEQKAHVSPTLCASCDDAPSQASRPCPPIRPACIFDWGLPEYPAGAFLIW